MILQAVLQCPVNTKPSPEFCMLMRDSRSEVLTEGVMNPMLRSVEEVSYMDVSTER